MKKIILYTFLSLVLFVGITYSTSSIQRPIDGDDSFGFPYRFYIAYSGMCNPCPEIMFNWNYFYLFLDLLIPFIIVFLFGSLLRRRKRVILSDDILDDLK